MKNARKALALILALVLALALCVTASAADPYTITITNSETGHTYSAYKLFAGDLDGDTLSNIQWGTGIADATLLSVIQDNSAFEVSSVNLFAGCETAADVAEVLVDSSFTAEMLEAFAKNVSANLGTASATTSTYNSTPGDYTISVTDPGYYFIKDELASSSQYAESRYILNVVKSVTITPKSNEVPTPDKKIDESTPVEGSAAYKVGDAVPFVLSATLPAAASYDKYASYALTFTDTLDAGLTAPAADDVKVYVGSTEVTTGFTKTVSGQTITVAFANTKATGVAAAAGAVITVEYSAVLNTNAIPAGTNNTFVLSYSNNPNGTGTGTAPAEDATVYTFDLVVTKTFSDSPSPAPVAGFTLYKGSIGTSNIVGTGEVSTTDGKATWNDLADGNYILVETTTPAGYNTMPNKSFTVTTTIVDGEREEIVITGDDASDFAGDETSGIVSTTIENQKGTVLPATGGAGTTALIVIGVVLFLGGMIVLVTKKRMYNAG